MSLPLSTIDVLQKLKDGEDVSVCDIFGSGQLEGQRGQEARLAALIAWVTNAAGSDSADALLTQILDAFTGTLTSQNRQLVEPLGYPSVARQLAAGASSASVALTLTCSRVSLTANGADIRFTVNGSAATSSSHFIASGTTKDFFLPSATTISAIRAGSTSGVLEITELS